MATLGTAWLLAIGSRPNLPTTVDAVAAALTKVGVICATFTASHGLWNGSLENTVVASIAGLCSDDVVTLARFLRARFEQDCIYVEQAGRAFLVWADRVTDCPAQRLDVTQLYALLEKKPPATAKSRRSRKTSVEAVSSRSHSLGGTHAAS